MAGRFFAADSGFAMQNPAVRRKTPGASGSSSAGLSTGAVDEKDMRRLAVDFGNVI